MKYFRISHNLGNLTNTIKSIKLSDNEVIIEVDDNNLYAIDNDYLTYINKEDKLIVIDFPSKRRINIDLSDL